MTVENILKNTDSKLLFKLFKEFTDKLVENTENLGIFAVDEGDKVFENSDIRQVIKEMKN